METKLATNMMVNDNIYFCHLGIDWWSNVLLHKIGQDHVKRDDNGRKRGFLKTKGGHLLHVHQEE